MKGFRLAWDDPEVGVVVARIFKTFEADPQIPWKDFARELEEAGGPKPADGWSERRIKQVLTCELYAGRWTLRRSGLPVPATAASLEDLNQSFYVDELVEPVVSIGQFERVQVLLEERSRQYQAGRKANHVFLLKGLLTCPHGGKFWGYARNHGQYRHLRADGKRGEPCSCALGGGYFDEEQLDNAVISAVVRTLEEPDLAARLRAEVANFLHDLRHGHTTEDVKRRIARLQERARRTMTLYLDADEAGSSMAEELREKHRCLQESLASAETLLIRLVRQQELQGALDRTARDIIETFGIFLEGMRQSDREGLQKLLRRVVEKVVVSETTLDVFIGFDRAL